jgi:hypothetical protein
VSRPVTLDQLTTDVSLLADVVGATLRHNPGDIWREINQAIQRFREWVTEEGYALYLTPFSTVLTVGPTSPFVWGEIDLAALVPSVAHVKAVEVTVDGVRYDLDKIPFESRNEYQQSNGPPVAWLLYGNRLGILPPSKSTYPVTVWYLGVFADLVNPTDEFDGIAGWEEWVRWTVLHSLLTRDQYPSQYSNAIQQADRIRAGIAAKIRADRPSVSRRRNVAGHRGSLARRGRWL